jgi:hypothetical protein
MYDYDSDINIKLHALQTIGSEAYTASCFLCSTFKEMVRNEGLGSTRPVRMNRATISLYLSTTPRTCAGGMERDQKLEAPSALPRGAGGGRSLGTSYT